MIDVLLPIAGSVIAILLTVVGFFLAKLFADHKELHREHSELKADFRVLKQRQYSDIVKQQSDIDRIEELLTEKLQNISQKIAEMQGTVNTFVNGFINKNNGR